MRYNGDSRNFYSGLILNSMYHFFVALLDVPIVISPFFISYFNVFLLQSSVCFNNKTTLVDGFLGLELVNKEGFE